jgi:hypothetical protein
MAARTSTLLSVDDEVAANNNERAVRPQAVKAH